MENDKRAQPDKAPQREPRLPSAGPHARRELMDDEKTPGAGTLPPVGEDEDPNAQPTS